MLRDRFLRKEIAENSKIVGEKPSQNLLNLGKRSMSSLSMMNF